MVLSFQVLEASETAAMFEPNAVGRTRNFRDASLVHRVRHFGGLLDRVSSLPSP